MLHLLDPANYSLNIYAFPMFAVGLCCSGLGLFVLIYGRASRLGIAFFFMSLNIGIYFICTGIDFISISDRVAMIWSKVGHMGVTFAPLSILLFVAAHFGLSQRYRIAIRLVIALSLIIVIGVIFTDLYFRDIKQFFWGRWAQFGPLGYVFMLLFFIVMVFIIHLFWREYRKSTDEPSKKRYGGILAAFGVGYIGSVDMLPALGLEVYPFGYIPIFLGCIIFAYVILRYRLVDITPELAANEILENMQEGVIVTDAEGIIRVVNSTACEMIGRQFRDLSGSSLASFMVLPKAVESAIRSGERSSGHEIVLTTGDDARMTVSLSVSPLRDKSTGEPVGFVYAAHDVTKRKKAEEALQESEERFRALSENAPDIIYTMDLLGAITYVNPSWKRIMGHDKEEVLGRYFIEFAKEEDKRTYRKLFKSIRDEGKTVNNHIGIMLTKDGKERIFNMNSAFSLDSQGRILGVVGSMKDVTDMREIERKFYQAQRMEAIGTLAGGVAHDLNNVLGVLVGYSELLLQNVPKDSPFQRHAMQIFKGGQRAAAIIQDLLTLTRRGVLVSETLNLNRIISDFLQMPEFEAIKSHHPGVQFKTSLDTELLNIKGSSTHLNKTVMNLLSNAAEAISSSGEVLIRTENRYVDRPIHGYDTTQEGEYAVLTVSDTGSGISPADLERIFEPFYTKKVMGRSGTGLGLAVVWGTVKDHDGYIDVQSTEGEGSVFTLYFRVTREDLTKAEQVVPQSTYMGRGEHILVVDDVEGQRLLASAMLEGLGYKVNTVASGEEAVEFVKQQPVDLLILDMIMDPGIDGLETYRRILEIRKDQKAIIVSGFSETDRVHTAQLLGAGAYARKPYVMEKLGLAVKKELDRK